MARNRKEKNMDRRDFMRYASVASISLATPARGLQRSVRDLGDRLEAIRKEHGLPGIAAAAVRGGRIVAEGVAGLRRVGIDDKITPDDRFALASCTKRMTSAMIARVIDSGKLSFDTTLAEALPEMPMRGDYRNVTLTQLLTFTGGIQPYTQMNPKKTPIMFELKGSAAEQREQFIKHLLQEEPIVKPGTERVYSNASYALAAFVAEQRTGNPWETLMQSEVFQPLHMTTAGFGRPRTKERPSEPAMHRKGDNGYEPEAERQDNAPRALAPAGDVHCSIRDFALFASYELNAAQGNDALLQPATAKRYQELSSGPRAEGRGFFGGSPFVSTGCVLWPSKNLAVVVAVNGGGAGDDVRAAFEAVKQREADFDT
jgi:CubicO group peptidase (beta-lactamase class C family)